MNKQNCRIWSETNLKKYFETLKSMVYANKLITLEALEVNINQAINEIRPKVLEKVVKNWNYRMCFVTISRGGHMPKIVFKT